MEIERVPACDLACCSVERSYFYTLLKLKWDYIECDRFIYRTACIPTELQNSAWAWIVESRLHGRRLNIVGNYFKTHMELRNALAKMACATLLNVLCLLVTIRAILTHTPLDGSASQTLPFVSLKNRGGSRSHLETKTNYDHDRETPDKKFEFYGTGIALKGHLEAFLIIKQ